VSTLIIKQGALGDVIIATALVDAIMKARPAGSVTLLTTPPFAGLFTDWADLRVVRDDGHAGLHPEPGF